MYYIYHTLNLIYKVNRYLETLCVVPFVHLSTKPSGKVRLCCFSQDYVKDNNGKVLHLGKESFSNIWNSPFMSNVRMRMLRGEKLEGCKNCWNEEAVGKQSKRNKENKRYLNKYKDRILSAEKQNGYISQKPVYLDLRLGNHCNLKCRTCNPLFSSLWDKELTQHENEKEEIYNTSLLTEITPSINDWYQTKTMLDTIKEMSSDLERVYLSGGEPFLIKEHNIF